MNPLVLFDYVYYRIAHLYEKTFDQIISEEFKSIALLSGFQLINGFTIWIVFIPAIELKNELTFILFSFFIFFLNIIRYKKVITYYELDEKWGKETGKVRLTKTICVICYFILTIFLFIYFINR